MGPQEKNLVGGRGRVPRTKLTAKWAKRLNNVKLNSQFLRKN